MGAVDDKLAVVDPELKIMGMSNVRVVDASVFPLMVSANPMLTVSLHFSFAEFDGVADGWSSC
jgi:choline dehydrogenase-like flavoprotein